MKKLFQKVLILGHYTVNDPTTENTIKTFSGISDHVKMIQQSPNENKAVRQLENTVLIKIYDFRHFGFLKGLVSIIRYWWYGIVTRWIMFTYKPDLVVTFMLYPLSVLKVSQHKRYKLLSCIYDIPSENFAGKFDRVINKKGWDALAFSNLVWSSDSYKAELTMKFGKLNKLPLVCHNCPSVSESNYTPGKRSLWLRKKLIDLGFPVTESSGCIILRAGAIGDFGGIEETLEIMNKLPEDVFFLMMGRPTPEYKAKLIQKINLLGLEKRAIIWDRPDDESWRHAIAGSDIGHLLHLEPVDNPLLSEMYQLNSSLSNYRLFNYMAAGLPILSYNDIRLETIHRQLDCFSVVNRDNIHESLFQNLFRLCSDKAFYNQQSAAALKGFTDCYNWQNQFSPVLNQLLKINPGL